MKLRKHMISRVLPDSIAEELGLEPGDRLVSVNGQPVEDVFDYRYLMNEELVVLLVEKPDGEEWELEVEKEYEEDLGIEFENGGLMDDYRSCSNKCMFCFIDQMPPGMRETLYFKDDDSRLSFLQGNYVTLTNMSEKDIERVIRYHLEPINISFQAMNPELRCKMLHNRFAGKALDKVDMLYNAGITMNGQIVLCKGVNDGDELEYSLEKLSAYAPVLQSVSVVPVGLTKYREGLYPLEPFNKEDAEKVLGQIERWQKIMMEKYGIHFIHASDEWYILADRELPCEDEYDGYLRVVVTDGDTNSVYVLDQELKETGSIKGLAEDERVYSARFMGKTGYFVTFKETDPLFSVDLSDPKNPKIIGALKIPGFSDYLHPYGKNKLLGIGMNVDEKTMSTDGVKLTMFDISDPENVKEEQTYVIENVYYTDVSYDYKAALVDAEKNLIGFAADSEGGREYYTFSYDEKQGFTCTMHEEINGNNMRITRGIYIEDMLYVIQGNIIEAYSLKDFKKVDDIIL